MKYLIPILVAGTALSGTQAHADNPRCIGSPDRYEGSKSGCPDARHPRQSRKGEAKAEEPAGPVEKQPEVKPVEEKADGTLVL